MTRLGYIKENEVDEDDQFLLNLAFELLSTDDDTDGVVLENILTLLLWSFVTTSLFVLGCATFLRYTPKKLQNETLKMLNFVGPYLQICLG